MTNGQRWENAISHAREALRIYRNTPMGFIAASFIAGDIKRYEGGERSDELLEALEGIEL